MTTATLKDEINEFANRHSESDLKLAISELVKRILPKNGSRTAIQIRDGSDKTVGVLLTDEVILNPDLSDYQTFLAIGNFRFANPPERYLTPDEFIARISAEPK